MSKKDLSDNIEDILPGRIWILRDENLTPEIFEELFKELSDEVLKLTRTPEETKKIGKLFVAISEMFSGAETATLIPERPKKEELQ